MERYSDWFQNCFHQINGPATTHEYQGYHMDLKDHLTPAFCLICEVIHKGRQANASATEKLNYWSHHKGQYSRGTFETKGQDLPLVQFPLPFKSKEFLDTGIHGDMEEGIFEIQPRTHGAMLEPFPNSSDIFHFEVNVTNELIEFLQIQDSFPFVRTLFYLGTAKYQAHLPDGSFIEKVSNINIE